MKAALCLASLAILAGVITAAPFAWDPDTVYTYRVQSRYAAGFLGLDGPTVDDTETDRALIELIWNVDVYKTTEPNTIFMNPREFKAVITKEQIHPREEPISSQKETAIPRKYQELLEKVMIVKLDPKSGVPDSIVVRADQPLSITEKNIKRAQVQAFILNPGTAKLIVKGNTQRSTNSVRPSEQDDDSGFYYKVMEESIHGECETYYHVSQTGPSQSLYQNEAQDVPTQDEQDSSNDQQRTRNPRFAGVQQMQQQQWKTQQQQQWKNQQQQQWNSHQQQQQWQTQQQQQQQQQWQTRQHQNQNENEVDQDDQQQPWPQAFQQYCENDDQVYVITKTVNLTACRDRPVLGTMMPSTFQECRPGDNNCGSLWTHVVNTRFLACGQNRQDFTIIEVNQEERFFYGLRVDQNIDGYVVKNVTLQQKERTSSNPAAAEMKDQGQNEYTIKSLVFEFDLKEQQKQLGGQKQQQWQQHQQQQQWQQQSSSHRHNQQQDSDSDSSEESNFPQGTNGPIEFPLRNQMPSLEQPPLRPQLISDVMTPTQLEQRLMALLEEAAHNIHDPRKSIVEGETISLVSVAAKGFTYMSLQQHLQFYEQILQKYSHDEELLLTIRSMALDAFCMSGTNPSLVAVMVLTETEKIAHLKAAQLVNTFAHYARHPTLEFLERFDQFIKSPVVQANEQIKSAAILAQSVLLYNACVDVQAKQSSYSFALYGPFCDIDDAEKYVDHHINALQKAIKMSHKEARSQGKSKDQEITLRLVALGNIGHKKQFKVVQEILDNSNDPTLKTQAIYSLRNLVRSRDEANPIQHRNGNVNTEQNQNEVDRVAIDPTTNDLIENKILPVLMSAALDNSEHPDVRSAAFAMVFQCTVADVTVWQQIAMYTWLTNSNQVHNLIYTTISSLAHLKVAPTPRHEQMIVNARSVFPLLRPLDSENAARSSTFFASGNADHLNSQYFTQVSWTGAEDTFMPNSFYFSNSIYLGSGAAGVQTVQASFRVDTLANVVENVEKFYGSSSSEESGEKNQYMQKILDNIVPRRTKQSPRGDVFVNIRQDMQRLWQLENLEKYLNLKNLPFIAALRRGIPINYQKIVKLTDQTMEFPTILGLAMTFKLHVPVILSVRGHAQLNAGPIQGQFHAQIDAVAGYKRHAKVALKIPYIQRKIESGIQSHFVAQVPLRITLRHRSDEPVIIAITPTANINGTASGKIELATFHRQPYVAVITDELYPTVHNKGGQMTVIRTLDAPTTNENHEDILGFSVRTQEISDYREEKETTEGWARYLSRFGNVGTFAQLGSYGGPDAKYSYRKLILDVDESESKTVIVLVAAKRGSGSLDEGFDTDVSSSSSSSSSTSESDSSDSSDSSSEENQQQNNRQARQQNQQRASSSSSSSSETNEDSNSNENSQEVLQKGNTIVLAVVTKKQEIPPVSRSGGVVDLLKAENPNQHQFIVQLSKRQDKFYLRYAHGSPAEDAASSLPTSSNSLQKLATAVIEPDYQGQQSEFCAELSAKINYPKFAHPRLLVALRDTLLNNELNVELQAVAQFAHTCKNQDLKQNEISMIGHLQRGRNMTEYARSKSQEAQQCQQDENQGFSISDDCMTVAVEQAAALDEGLFMFQWSEGMPKRLQQAVYNTRDLVKAVYVAHASDNRFSENSDSVTGNGAIVRMRISPDAKYWSVGVLTNETELQIQNVPSNALIQAALPLSALQSVVQNMKDSVFGEASQPTCQLEGNTISSFDNVVDQIDTNVAEGCYHLLTADGSGQDSMAVMAKNLGTDNVKLQLILSQNKIQLSSQRSVPRARLSQVEQANDIAATVNGQSVALPYTIRKQGQRAESNDYVARIQLHPSGGVQILTPKNDIAFDGGKIIIFIDESYRNKTVGLCGDFNGEQVADRRSRKDIPLSSATLLYANYAYNAESSQCQVKEETKQQIKQEEAFAQINRNGNGNHGSGHQNQNLHSATSWTRAQQRNAWQNRPYNNQQDDSSSEEGQNSQSRHSSNNRQHGRH